MKRYRLPLSREFPASHPRKGEHTFFREKIMAALGWHEELRTICFQEPKPKKPHTIRKNVKWWQKIIDEVNAGKAVLEVYEWTGLPYKSKTRTLFVFDKDSGIGYQILTRSDAYYVDGMAVPESLLAQNDGLSLPDFMSWFSNADFSEPKIIIHFTNFRYDETTIQREGNLQSDRKGRRIFKLGLQFLQRLFKRL